MSSNCYKSFKRALIVRMGIEMMFRGKTKDEAMEEMRILRKKTVEELKEFSKKFWSTK